MEFEKISLRTRRRFSRYQSDVSVELRLHGLFGRKQKLLMTGIGPNGIELSLKKSVPAGVFGRVKIPHYEGEIPIVCRWVRQLKQGEYISGWRVSKQEDNKKLEQFIQQNEFTLFEDRRSGKNDSELKLRLQDHSVSNAVIEADQFPLYRRSSVNDRRNKDRRSVNKLVGKNKRKNDRRRIDRRHDGAYYPAQNEGLSKSLRSVITAVRDTLIPHLPQPVVRLLVGKGEFVFIAHPRDQRDVVRMFPFSKWLPESWVKKWFMRQKPFIAAPITGLKDKDGKAVKGWFLIAPRWTVQMMKDNQMGREVIADTVKLAEKLGAKIAGLGAFTSIVTHDGKDLLDNSQIGLTTGNPLSAAIAIQNVVKAASLVGLDLHKSMIAIVGAGGSVGSGCSRLLAHKAGKLLLIDVNKRSLSLLSESLLGISAEIQTESDLSNVKNADVVVVVTNSPGAIIHAEHLKPGAIVIDCAQPKNVSDEVPKKRDDVLIIESAIVETPGVRVHFDMDLNAREALGCLAETMVLTYMRWPSSYALGKAPEHQVREVYEAARKAGFRLAYFRNSEGYITGKDLIRVGSIIKDRIAR